MKFSLTTVALAALTPLAFAEELQPLADVSRYYDSGAVHEAIMARKTAFYSQRLRDGVYQSQKWSIPAFNRRRVECKNGKAEVVKGNPLQTFKCLNFDYYDFKSHAELGSKVGEGSSSWGWTSPKGREFVAVGQYDGTAFAEITKKGELVYLGRLPQYDPIGSFWREIRSYKNYMVIGSEAVGHGVQIFDMTKLLNIDPKSPRTFSNQGDLTGYWNETPLGRTHNVHANEEMGYAFAVGAQPRNSTCRSGIQFIDLADITKPVSPGCAADDGYVHDLECLVYRGPHKKYAGKPICYGYNEDTLTIYDITDKTKTNIISRTTYVGANYTHQGSVLNKDWQEYIVLDDELDEVNRIEPAAEGFPVTYIWDIRNLEAPKQTGVFTNRYAKTIDHNQYVHKGFSYQSQYGAGLHVLDVSSIPKDPSGKGVKLAGFFDIYPEDDAVGGEVEFTGTWSHYPYFKSGYILINTIERGAFIVKYREFSWTNPSTWF